MPAAMTTQGNQRWDRAASCLPMPISSDQELAPISSGKRVLTSGGGSDASTLSYSVTGVSLDCSSV